MKENIQNIKENISSEILSTYRKYKNQNKHRVHYFEIIFSNKIIINNKILNCLQDSKDYFDIDLYYKFSSYPHTFIEIKKNLNIIEFQNFLLNNLTVLQLQSILIELKQLTKIKI